MPVNLGDLAELLAFACVGVFVALYFAPVWALLVGAVGLFYMAQGLPSVKLPPLRLRKGDR